MFKNFLTLFFVFLILGACAQRFSSKPTSFPRAYNSRAENESSLQELAEEWLDTPYRVGGNDKTGIDCSGLAVVIYKQVYGIKLPRSTRKLRRLGYSIGKAYVRPGDLLFFRMKRNAPLNHVGVYLGRGRFIHATSSRGVVISSFEDPFYQKHLVTARRIRR